MTYFEVFSLPPKLALDAAALEKQFYKLSREFHPDRFASKPAEEQTRATEMSSLLNDAYRTLKNPIQRTEYLLTLEGIELEEQSVKATEAAKAAGTQKKQLIPADLLEEVFQLNMDLEEMRETKESGNDDPMLRKNLESAKSDFTAMLESSQQSLESEWKRWDSALDANDESAKSAAKAAMVETLNRRSYLRNLLRDVNAVLES